jgi:hypothetical protein
MYKFSKDIVKLLYVFSSPRSASISQFRDILRGQFRKANSSDIGDRYCFWIWTKLLVVVPSSKKPTSSEQTDEAKHIQTFKSL